MCQTTNAAKSNSAAAVKAKETVGAKHNEEEYQINTGSSRNRTTWKAENTISGELRDLERP